MTVIIFSVCICVCVYLQRPASKYILFLYTTMTIPNTNHQHNLFSYLSFLNTNTNTHITIVQNLLRFWLCNDQLVEVLVQGTPLLPVDEQEVVGAVTEGVPQYGSRFLVRVFPQKLLGDFLDLESVGDTREQHNPTEVVAEGGVDLP